VAPTIVELTLHERARQHKIKGSNAFTRYTATQLPCDELPRTSRQNLVDSGVAGVAGIVVVSRPESYAIAADDTTKWVPSNM